MNSVKFYSEVEKIKRQKRDMTYMDAVVFYCEETFYSIAKIFNWNCEIIEKDIVILKKI